MRPRNSNNKIAAGLYLETPESCCAHKANAVPDNPSFEEVIGDIGAHLLVCLSLAVAAQLLVPMLVGQ